MTGVSDQTGMTSLRAIKIFKITSLESYLWWVGGCIWIIESALVLSGQELDNIRPLRKLFVVGGGCIWKIESAPVPFLRFEMLDDIGDLRPLRLD